jgi:hypothetical protein
MKTISITGISIALMFAITVQVYSQFLPLTLKDKIKPQTDPKLVTSPMDPVNVQILVNEMGIPEEVIASPGLCDAVVRAIAAARFNPATDGGKPVPASARLTIPIHREIDYFYQVQDRPAADDSAAMKKLLAEGRKLTPTAASALEKKLNDSKDSIPSRASLIGFASANVGEEFRRLQRRQIAWMVRNSPESSALGLPSSMLFNEGTLLVDPDGYKEVRSIWLDQLAVKPADPIIVGHASYFFRLSDRETAEKLLLDAMPKVSGASGWLGELYGLAALGVTSLDYTNDMTRTTGLSLPDSGFGKHAQSELLNSSDARVVLSALATVTSAGRNLARLRSIPAGFADFCESLRSRAQMFISKNVYSCETTSIDPNSITTHSVTAGKLKKHPNPKFPADARKQHIEGELKFSALVGEDGRIKTLDFVKGPLIFYPSTRETILTWEYEPTRLDGSPVEIITTITVNFDFKGKN